MITKFIKYIFYKIVHFPKFPLVEINESSLTPEQTEIYHKILYRENLRDLLKEELEYGEKYKDMFVDIGNKRDTEYREKHKDMFVDIASKWKNKNVD